jgi:hypothetical protein
MARKVLNKSASGLTPAIKSVATTKTSRMSTQQTNNVWYTSNGYSATLSRQENDSRILVNAPWRYTGGTASYFAGMGIRTIWPNGTGDNTFGWSYYWQYNTGDGSEGLFQCMKGLYNGHGLTASTGNFEFRIGHNSANGDANRPGYYWTSDRSEDSRGNGNDMAHFIFREISADKTSWNTNSGGQA